MSEMQQQTEPVAAEKMAEPLETPLKPWTFRATHRRPAVAWLIVLLLVLQLVLGGIVIAQACKLLDLGKRIEHLENKQSFEEE